MSSSKSKAIGRRRPKGILIPIGGGEDKSERKIVLARLIRETAKKKPKICVITIASSVPRETGGEYRAAFKGLGIPGITFIHAGTRPEIDTKKNIEKIRSCDAILFSGGNQLRLSSLLGGTALLDEILARYYSEPHFVIAGTSAGAAAMSDTMIIAGSSQDAMIKGELELTNGLDIIHSVFIDSHFTERGRFGRLIQTVTCNPGILGLGLGEDTAVVIYRGNEMEVVGSGLVVLVDGNEIQYTDLTEISNGTPITVQGLKMHVLGPGKRFLINERSLARVGKVQKKKARE